MIQCKYFRIYRDKNDNIIGYGLMDRRKKTMYLRKGELKTLIKAGKLEVVNLTLTSDNRLIPREYKPMVNNTSRDLVNLQNLTDKLNLLRDSYYNKSHSLVSDYEYDSLFDELTALEKKLGTVLPNSPTRTVGYKVNTKWNTVKHNHPMLSLDKTKSVMDLKKFAIKPYLLMHKLDGLTITLCYSGTDGHLVSAETRGNGEMGEDVTKNARYFGVPMRINYRGNEDFIIDGEAIIDIPTFERINNSISERDGKYKNARNLAAGTVRNFDPGVVAQRGVKFIAWKVIKGCMDCDSHTERLQFAESLGFKIVDFVYHSDPSKADMQGDIDKLRGLASKMGIPIDGLVIGYDSVRYGDSLGMTGHHIKSQLAFKFYDEEEMTILRNIEWSMGKTGCLTPVAVFDTVEIDGTEVNRASVHNLGMVKDLKLGINDEITVYKANQIIPQIRDNLTKSGKLVIPGTCPVCGSPTKEVYSYADENNSTLNLVCSNENCRGKLLGKFTYFVSKPGMDIDGLSEATLKKLIECGWLEKLSDIYELYKHREEIARLEGFGDKSAQNLVDSIEKSRDTSLARFITALSIPTIGRKAGKQIAEDVKYDLDMFILRLRNHESFKHLEDFGDKMNECIHIWAVPSNIAELERFKTILRIQKPQIDMGSSNVNTNIVGKTFVITGSLHNYPNREALKEKLESMGARVSGSVTSKTNYLINNDINSTSSKNKKAKELGVPIISEEDLVKLY